MSRGMTPRSRMRGMRKLTILPAALLLLLVACTQERTDTNATVGDNSTVATSTHTETTTVPTVTVDTMATAAAKAEVKETGHEVKDAAKSAEHSTGTALEKAGKNMQKDAKKH